MSSIAKIYNTLWGYPDPTRSLPMKLTFNYIRNCETPRWSGKHMVKITSTEGTLDWFKPDGGRNPTSSMGGGTHYKDYLDRKLNREFNGDEKLHYKFYRTKGKKPLTNSEMREDYRNHEPMHYLAVGEVIKNKQVVFKVGQEDKQYYRNWGNERLTYEKWFQDGDYAKYITDYCMNGGYNYYWIHRITKRTTSFVTISTFMYHRDTDERVEGSPEHLRRFKIYQPTGGDAGTVAVETPITEYIKYEYGVYDMSDAWRLTTKEKNDRYLNRGPDYFTGEYKELYQRSWDYV